ncbi:mitochondrion organization and biogenesis-related protein [Moniliophthora roreri]|uniref:Mitochondrial distribution and morphology protein 34 n=1 Tax=Moniliophthora roreri TaxID=221103 RepID=A0A0W0FQ35_MONRR|nr:mitochondrion organization and biogenesis-related protein [Moniliophthora roreri]
MSFTFNWPRFSDQFHYDAIQMLNNALNKGSKPPVIADKIEVVELEMGTEPPELEIREIGELTMDQFRGIFRLSYSGDAHLVLKTKVQANPLNHKQPDIHLMAGNKGMLAARQPLVVPMLLRLSHFKLRSIVVLVVSKQKGITLVFKTDPLQNVDINSTFDSIAVIQKFIQKEIEGQLRQMFREDLPGIIHRLSQQWVKAKIEAPYLSKRPPPTTRQPSAPAPLSFQNVAGVPSIEDLHRLRHRSSMESGGLRKPSVARSSYSSSSRPTAMAAGARSLPPPSLAPQEIPESTFPDLENFDPTYGLRPEGLPTKSLFKGFGGLFTPTKGLAELMEEESEEDGETAMYDYDDSSTTYDVVDWEGGLSGLSRGSSSELSPTEQVEEHHNVEYETIPAVGGGTIVRPRVFHSQSMIQPSPDVNPAPLTRNSRLSRSHDSIASALHSGMVLSPNANLGQRRPNSSYNPYFPESATGITSGVGLRTAHSYHGTPLASPQIAPAFLSQSGSRRPVTPDSLETQQSYSSGDHTRTLLTPPEDESLPMQIPYRRPSSRRSSVSSMSNLDPRYSMLISPTSANFADFLSNDIGDPTPKIVLRPSPLNNTLSKLSTLSHSNHTLSPYTRSLEHFTVRSVPPRYTGGLSGSSGISLDRQPVKAKRKRTYHIGGSKKTTPPPEASSPQSETTTTPADLPTGTTTSDFDISDMDRYFRDGAASDRETHGNHLLHPIPGPFTGSPTIHPRHFRLRTSYIHPE